MREDQDEPDFSAVPLFPLPNVVLFPRAVLPLHIFEERYKMMFADALRGGRRLAMALLRPGWETNYHGRPAIEPVVCVGTILTHERLADGRYNFLLQGSARARVAHESGEQPYRIGELDLLPESPALEIDLEHERRRLAQAFAHERIRSTVLGKQFRELLDGIIPTAELADLIAFYYFEDVRLKQRLLAEPDVRRRVELVTSTFEAMSPAMSLN